MNSLAVIDPTSSVAVTSYLEQAKNWLATAVENTGPEQIAKARAEIATVAEATKQLHLSKDIQLDAQEMVRRAEYAINRSIRVGQENGSIMTGTEAKVHAGKVRQHGVGYADLTSVKPRPMDFVERHEWNNTQGGISDLDIEPEQFEEVLAEAKAEGNLSRANVVRKVKSAGGPAVVTRDMRAEMIRNLAEQGYTSRQMPEKVGVTEESVRLIARDFNIEIPADKVVGKQRRMNHTQMVEQTVIALANEVDALKYIDFSEVDFSEADEWVASLSQSISKLRKFANRIKETTHVV